MLHDVIYFGKTNKQYYEPMKQTNIQTNNNNKQTNKKKERKKQH